MTHRQTCHDIIIQLLAHLPDSVHDDESWRWCWEELGDAAQDAVKAARKLANEFLKGKLVQ